MPPVIHDRALCIVGGMYVGQLEVAVRDRAERRAIDTLAHAAATRPAPLTLVNLWRMGGAISDVDAEDTALAERPSPFMMSIDGNWSDAAMDTRARHGCDSSGLRPFRDRAAAT